MTLAMLTDNEVRLFLCQHFQTAPDCKVQKTAALMLFLHCNHLAAEQAVMNGSLWKFQEQFVQF